MSGNMVFADVESRRRVAEVGTDVAPGTALLIGGIPAVTVTGSGDYDGNAISVSGPGISAILAGGRGGVGLADTEATVTFTGSHAFPVTGATKAAITNGVTKVYITSGGALTLTADSNTYFGIADFFRGELSTTDTVVRIGD